MAETPEEPRDVSFRWDVPAEQSVGVYANNVNVWHSPYEFTLDFAVTEPPQVSDPDDPASPLTVPNTVVARVRMPVALIFDAMRAMNNAMDAYEAAWGAIKRPEAQQ